MYIKRTKSILFVFAFYCSCSIANYKVFEAPLDESDWIFSGNPLGCKLTHDVPMYGNAIFQKRAGRNKKLAFQLNYKRQAINSKTASVQSLSPSWLPNQRARDLGETAVLKGNPIFKINKIVSWKLLSELEVGRFPTFRYQEFEAAQDQVAVSLSAVGFKQPYNQFLNCLTTIVPYQLNELNKMTLRFDFDKYSLKNIYHKKIKALAAYVRYDPSIEVVFINGYTDSKGTRGYNQKLSQKRIATVQKLLTLEGTDSSRFKTIAYGEKNPVASNRKVSGRALNRRVYIKVRQQ